MCDRHQFTFEFDKAYSTQLIEKFEASPEHPLAEDVAPPSKGVYALYWRTGVVYAGKAMEGITLRRRLAEHCRKIGGRQNIDLGEVSCRFLIIDSDWFVRAAEDALIASYRPVWQKSGFGSHVPGGDDPGRAQAAGMWSFQSETSGGPLRPENHCRIVQSRLVPVSCSVAVSDGRVDDAVSHALCAYDSNPCYLQPAPLCHVG